MVATSLVNTRVVDVAGPDCEAERVAVVEGEEAPEEADEDCWAEGVEAAEVEGGRVSWLVLVNTWTVVAVADGL